MLLLNKGGNVAKMTEAEFAKSIGAVPVPSKMTEAQFAKSIGAVPIEAPKKRGFFSRIGHGIEGQLEDVGSGLKWLGREAGSGLERFGKGVGRTLQIPSEAAMEMLSDPQTSTHVVSGALRPIVNVITQHVLNPWTQLLYGYKTPVWKAPAQPDPATELGGLASLAVPVAGEAATVEAVPEVMDLLKGADIGERTAPLTGAPRAATRAAYWAGVNAAQGGSPLTGAATSLVGEIPFGKALKATVGRGARKVVRSLSPLQQAQEAARAVYSGGLRDVGLRTPSEVQDLRDQLAQEGTEKFPLTLSGLTRAQPLESMEQRLFDLPVSGLAKRMRSMPIEERNFASSIVNDLKSAQRTQDLRADVRNDLVNAHERAKAAMAKAYEPIESSLNDSGFTINSRRHTNAAIDRVLKGEKEKIQRGIPSPTPDFTPNELKLLKQIRQGAVSGRESRLVLPPEIERAVNIPKQATFKDWRELESDMKKKARQLGSGSTPRLDAQIAFNTIAKGMRDDVKQNAIEQGRDDIVPALELANKLAKENYYDVWNKPEIHKLMDEAKKGDNFYNVLLNGTHKKLLNQLRAFSPSATTRLFLAGLAPRLRSEAVGEAISPVALSKFARTDSFKDKDAQELLTPELREKFDRLGKLADINKFYKTSKAYVPTGKMIRDLSLRGFPNLLRSAAFGAQSRIRANELLSPESIERYITGRKPGKLETLERLEQLGGRLRKLRAPVVAAGLQKQR